MNDAPQKDTRNMADVFIEKLAGADRVVLETKNALGEMDAHYLYAPDIFKAFNARADHAQAELQAAVAAERNRCADCVVAADSLELATQGTTKIVNRVYDDADDAQAALESVKRKARIEELEAEVAHLTTENDEYARLASIHTGAGILRKRLKDRAALEAVKREARNEGRREAADVSRAAQKKAQEEINKILVEGFGGKANDIWTGRLVEAQEIKGAILALMEDTDDGK